jgi:taurine dioxygenase
MYAAYDGLSVPIKTLIEGLSAEHSSRYVFGEAKASDVVHLMVIKHPLLGRPALYLNPQFTTKILGQSGIESVGLLKRLFDHCLRPDIQCRISYGRGDTAM